MSYYGCTSSSVFRWWPMPFSNEQRAQFWKYVSTFLRSVTARLQPAPAPAFCIALRSRLIPGVRAARKCPAAGTRAHRQTISRLLRAS